MSCLTLAIRSARTVPAIGGQAAKRAQRAPNTPTCPRMKSPRCMHSGEIGALSRAVDRPFLTHKEGRRKKGDGPWATHTHLICRATARSERWASRVDKSRAMYRKRPEITTPRERQARAAAAGERWRRMCLWCQQNKKRNRNATGRAWVCNGADRWTRRMRRKRETAKVGGETGSCVSKVSKTSIESLLAQRGGREEGGPCPCSWCCRGLTHNY